jgi:hypothetical protein
MVGKEGDGQGFFPLTARPINVNYLIMLGLLSGEK